MASRRSSSLALEFAGTVTGCAGKRSPPASCVRTTAPAAAGVKICAGNGSSTRLRAAAWTAGTASLQPAPVSSGRCQSQSAVRASIDSGALAT